MTTPNPAPAVQAELSEANDTDRPVILHICKDGTITFRRMGQKIFNGVALPFFSVESEKEAEELQIMLCAKQYVSHPKMPDKPWYVFRFGGELDDIPQAADAFRAAYALVRSRATLIA